MPRNITVQFSDGTSHIYQNAPDDITPDAVMARASTDFSGKNITHLDGGRGGSQIEKDTTAMITNGALSQDSSQEVQRKKPYVPDRRPPPSNFSVARNAIVKGSASIPDAVINTPTNLYNLGKAAIGTGLAMAGRPDLSPDLTESPNVISQGLREIPAVPQALSIRPQDEPATKGQEYLDTAIQGATGMLLTGKPTLTGAAIGGLSGVTGKAVGEATDSPLLGTLAAVATGGLGAKTVQGGVGAKRWLGQKIEPQELKAAREIAAASGMSEQDVIAALANKKSGIVSNPETGDVTQNSVPQIMQNSGVSQLARSTQSLGSSALSELEAKNNAIRMAAIEGIAPTSGSINEAAANAGNSIFRNAVAERDAMKKQSGENYKAVDAKKDIRILFPADEMAAIEKKYYATPGNSNVSAHIDIGRAIGTKTEKVTTPVSPDSYGILPRDAEGKPISSITKEVTSQVPLSWDDFNAMRKRIGNAQQAARSGANPDPVAAAALGEMKAALDKSRDRVASGGGVAGENFSPESEALYQAANKYHSGMKDKFESGAQQGMFRTGSDNQLKTQGAEIPPKFFNSGASQIEDAKSFNKLINGDNGLAKEMRSYATTKLADKPLSYSTIDKFMKAHSGAIKEIFPNADRNTLDSIRTELKSVSDAERLNLMKGSATSQNKSGEKAVGRLAAMGGRLAGVPVIGHINDLINLADEHGNIGRAKSIGELLANPDELQNALATVDMKNKRGIFGGNQYAQKAMLIPAIQQSKNALDRTR